MPKGKKNGYGKKRQKMTRNGSKRQFRSAAGVHRRNFVTGSPMRGGIRL